MEALYPEGGDLGTRGSFAEKVPRFISKTGRERLRKLWTSLQ